MFTAEDAESAERICRSHFKTGFYNPQIAPITQIPAIFARFVAEIAEKICEICGQKSIEAEF